MTQPLNRASRLPALGKIDHEGGEFWVDSPFLLLNSGHNLSSYERNRLYLNHDGKSFFDASVASQTDIDSDSRSAIACDFDRDGAVDLLVGSAGGGPLRLFLNRWELPHHRVAVDLVGNSSNRAGVGARIIVHCGDRQIVRDRFRTNSFMGMAPIRRIIGLGSARRIDRLQVRWPSGQEQTFSNLPVDVRLTIEEGSTRVQSSPLPLPSR